MVSTSTWTCFVKQQRKAFHSEDVVQSIAPELSMSMADQQRPAPSIHQRCSNAFPAHMRLELLMAFNADKDQVLETIKEMGWVRLSADQS
jgi:hypothetical protein